MEKGLVYFTRRERFCAAHKLWNPKWDAATNHDMYGKCAHENWHGHNYVLFVTVKGIPDPDSGMIMDLRDLKRVIKDNVIIKMDHRNLNLDVDFLQGKISTAENLVKAIWEELEKPIEEIGVQLHQIKVIETENNYAEYFG